MNMLFGWVHTVPSPRREVAFRDTPSETVIVQVRFFSFLFLKVEAL
ncbi:unnamed protein product [Penicillium roqueforti FM164]|uniref:Genomic scaffold, ProqFM164S02 n=1 Tax=Penicillium roqueforti (strain FM164) TaxID=1365484 RepID=W6Q909_PENRF|nr:unnamed protein product [Penicillium roqueforti FM164]